MVLGVIVDCGNRAPGRAPTGGSVWDGLECLGFVVIARRGALLQVVRFGMGWGVWGSWLSRWGALLQVVYFNLFRRFLVEGLVPA